jgi:hypothetical protein
VGGEIGRRLPPRGALHPFDGPSEGEEDEPTLQHGERETRGAALDEGPGCGGEGGEPSGPDQDGQGVPVEGFGPTAIEGGEGGAGEAGGG